MSTTGRGSDANTLLGWLKVYALPLTAIVAWLAAASAIFGAGFWRALAARLSDVAWWAEATWSVIFLSVAVSWLVAITQERRARLERAPFEYWTMELRGLKSASKPSLLYWEDVRRILASPFEEWKFVKSAVSPVVWIETTDLEAARARWLGRDDRERRIVVDFSGMDEEDDIASKNWPEFTKKLADHEESGSEIEQDTERKG